MVSTEKREDLASSSSNVEPASSSTNIEPASSYESLEPPSSKEVQEWWGPERDMSKLELDFKTALKVQDQTFLGNAPVRAMVLGRKSWMFIDRPEKLSEIGSHAMIILQDLSREWVEFLGPRLDIPVSIFALHWANPTEHVVGEVRVPIGESPARHFVLNYRQPLPFLIKDRQSSVIVKGERKDLEYRLNCNIVRPITLRSKTYQDHETSEQLVTFYATKQSGVGPSILLLDPMIAGVEHAVRRYTLSNEGAADEGFADCSQMSYPAMPPLCRLDGRTELSDREYLGQRVGPSLLPSLFAELSPRDIEFLRTKGLSSPLSAIYLIRRLVLARNVASVTSLLQDTIRLTGDASIGVDKIADFNFDTFEQRAWVDEWRGKFFRQLWLLREDLEVQGYRLKQNHRIVTSTKLPMGMSTKGLNPGDLKDIKTQEKADLAEWRDLEDLRLYAVKIMERTTDSYLQTVQATGAQFANMQSKSVARLTGLLGLFVPASLCGIVLTIPSYGGSKENQKFWIFWVVSVPLAVILMVFFFTSWPTRVHDQWKHYRQHYEEKFAPKDRDLIGGGERMARLRRIFKRSKRQPQLDAAFDMAI